MSASYMIGVLGNLHIIAGLVALLSGLGGFACTMVFMGLSEQTEERARFKIAATICAVLLSASALAWSVTPDWQMQRIMLEEVLANGTA